GLGRKKRIEDARPDLFGDSASVIDDAYHHATLFAVGAHVDTTGLWNRIERVVDQVRPDLVELTGEASDAGEIAFRVDDHGGGMTSRFRPEHGDGVAEA